MARMPKLGPAAASAFCVFAGLLFAGLQEARADPPLIEIHPVVDCATVPGTDPLLLPQARGQCLGREIIVGDGDVVNIAHRQNRMHQDELELMLRPEAGQKMNAYVRDHLGQFIGFVVDGRTVSVAFLADPAVSTVLDISEMPASQIDQIVDRFRTPKGGI